MDIKQEIINEIDNRISLLKAHENDEIIKNGNQYSELNQALAKVIGMPLMGELNSIKEFIENLE